MKSTAPQQNSGKTRFNRGKAKGESWTKLRDAAKCPKKQENKDSTTLAE